MERVIFCPSEEHIEEARRLAQLWMLPIRMGSPDETIESSADTAVLMQIPEDVYVDYQSPIFENEMWRLVFVDDFDVCETVNAELFECDEDNNVTRLIGQMKPTVVENHKIVFYHRFPRLGRYNLILSRHGLEICQNLIEVLTHTRRKN